MQLSTRTWAALGLGFGFVSVLMVMAAAVVPGHGEPGLQAALGAIGLLAIGLALVNREGLAIEQLRSPRALTALLLWVLFVLHAAAATHFSAGRVAGLAVAGFGAIVILYMLVTVAAESWYSSGADDAGGAR